MDKRGSVLNSEYCSTVYSKSNCFSNSNVFVKILTVVVSNGKPNLNLHRFTLIYTVPSSITNKSQKQLLKS